MSNCDPSTPAHLIGRVSPSHANFAMPSDLLSYAQLATMADFVADSQSLRADSPGAATNHVRASVETTAIMRPGQGRRSRATLSPTPAPQGRGSTPMRDSVTGQLAPELGASSRTPVPAKYSISYGSPMTQLPDRSTVHAGGNLTKAAAEIFTIVKRDNVAADVRRRAKDQARAARGGKTPSPPAKLQPTIEVDEPESEEHSEGGEEASDYEDQGDDDDEDNLKRQTKKRGAKKSPQKAVQKRPRDDEEAEARAEQERKERNERLRRERSEEARNVRKQKQAESRAARQQDAQERLAQQACRGL
ncbi:hypothetical protein N658DRAFT_146764 [Parathielavia hyrcaniae]|uniref:Uncharacterized protein n=1 Tax=Parathielavia hyrcaniae TaxID=113614 RepID=A0AAN6PQ57_9PEZI|nr:hypothetical protein N658DRAFT_146764 [Parathielavia hyrcaniae]